MGTAMVAETPDLIRTDPVTRLEATEAPMMILLARRAVTQIHTAVETLVLIRTARATRRPAQTTTVPPTLIRTVPATPARTHTVQAIRPLMPTAHPITIITAARTSITTPNRRTRLLVRSWRRSVACWRTRTCRTRELLSALRLVMIM